MVEFLIENKRNTQQQNASKLVKTCALLHLKQNTNYYNNLKNENENNMIQRVKTTAKLCTIWCRPDHVRAS